jgi:hypothetical protein
MKRLMAATVLVLAATSNFVGAQAPAAGDPHHPPGAATPVPAPAQPTPPPGQQGMMGSMPMMMNMMGGMPMMGMMRMMGMMGPGMATIDRVDGRIAFLHTELKIKDAQASAWNAFADALRTNARKLGEVRASMMPQPGGAVQPQPSTLAVRLDLQERWLLARLEGTRTIKTAFTNLYGTLSDEQKKTADELLAPHMGIEMGMTMMSGAMQQGQMGTAQTGSGRMQPDGR